MIHLTSICAFLACMVGALADPVIVVYQLPTSATVVSPLTAPVAQSGQALLSQINATLAQRRFEHQVLTLTQPSAQPLLFNSNVPRVIRAR